MISLQLCKQSAGGLRIFDVADSPRTLPWMRKPQLRNAHPLVVSVEELRPLLLLLARLSVLVLCHLLPLLLVPPLLVEPAVHAPDVLSGIMSAKRAST